MNSSVENEESWSYQFSSQLNSRSFVLKLSFVIVIGMFSPYDDRMFSVATPRMWNSVHLHRKTISLLDTFKILFKNTPLSQGLKRVVNSTLYASCFN